MQAQHGYVSVKVNFKADIVQNLFNVTTRSSQYPTDIGYTIDIGYAVFENVYANSEYFTILKYTIYAHTLSVTLL